MKTMKTMTPAAPQSLQIDPAAAKKPKKISLFEALPVQIIEDVLIPSMSRANARAAFAETSWAAHQSHMRVAVLQNLRDLKSGLRVETTTKQTQALSAVNPKERFAAAKKRASAVYALGRIKALFSAGEFSGAMGSQIGGHMGSIADAFEAIGQAAMAAASVSKVPRSKFLSPVSAELKGNFRTLEAVLAQRLDAWVTTEALGGANAAMAKHRILAAIANESSHLDLSGLDLRTLPPIADYLPSLRSLNVSGNLLSTFVEELKPLKKLRNVNLFDNKISVIPADIDQLTSLTALRLGLNDLTSVPPELGSLTGLRDLDLSGNRIFTLPPQMGQLKRLRFLNISANDLATLPAEMAQLKALITLDLSDNAFVGFPAPITQLEALESLDISDNAMTQLTAQIASMRSLKALRLDGTPIQNFPAEMGKLGSLRFLSFEDTSIMSLPAEFRQLPLKLVRGTQWFAALVFTDYVEMNTQIWSLTVALDRLLAPNRNASRTDAEKMAAKIDGLKKDLNLALQTELDSFYNRVNITH